MIPLEDARARVLSALPSPVVIDTAVENAVGLVLAEPVSSPSTVPPFDNSAMDGYAVRFDDLAEIPVTLPVVADVAAGHLAEADVTPGTAVKIMTGAPLPAGADTIVRVEDTLPGDSEVTIHVRPDRGTSVRSAGGDVRAGDRLFETGELLNPRHVGVLSSVGVVAVKTFRRMTVGVVSTGDEVMPPDSKTLDPGQIRDSNRPLLRALLAEVGAEVIDYGIVGDDAQALTQTFTTAAERCDAVITSGGVSMGDYDLVKQVLVSLGGVDLWKVAMQPAKPFAFGAIAGTPLFGLPGNPVSVFVAFEQFARPALLKMMGHRALARPRLVGVMEEAVETDPEKTVFLRVTVKTRGGVRSARLAGGQGSNILSAAARADAFAVVERGSGRVAAGESVPLEMFGWANE